MVLTKNDIEGQEFPITWRGYDQREVDRFLDLAASSIDQLTRERDAAARRAETIERDAAETLGAERLLKRALVEAQQTADQTIAEARVIAEETVVEARRAAEELVADARRETEIQLHRARAQAAGVRQAVEELHRFRSEYGERVRAVMQRIGELPPLPQAIDQLPDRAQSAAPAFQQPVPQVDPPPELEPAPPSTGGEPALTPAGVGPESSGDDAAPSGPPWM